MAEGLEAFLSTIGPEFAGKAQTILDATGVVDLEELLDLVESREDLRDLDKEEVGMKALHVKKLFRAIMNAKETGVPAAGAAAPAQQEEQPREERPETSVVQPREGGAKMWFPLKEKQLTALPEDEVKEPSSYVACADASKHQELPVPEVQPEASVPTPAKEPVPMPDPMKREPLLLSKPKMKAASQPKPQKYRPKTGDFPDMGPASAMPGVTRDALEQGAGAAAAQRAFQAAELARLAAEQAAAEVAAAAGGGAAAAANAALSRRMLQERQEARLLRREAYNRVVEFYWDSHTFQFVNGRAQHGIDSPVSALSEEEFKVEFAASLKTFCEANPPDGGLAWEPPEIEEWLAFEPSPRKSTKGKEIKPYALVMFKSLEDVQYLEHIYLLRMQAEDPRTIPILKIKKQNILVQRPNPKFLQWVDESSKGSEVASQAGSVAGSEQSHSSASPSELRNLTLLFMNLPEAVHSSLSQRPAAKQQVESYVKKVLDGPPALPVARNTVKFAASFSEPQKAPYGGCWLTFKYLNEKKRIHDGKPYTLQEFKEMYKNKKDEKIILEWGRGPDAVFELEKTLGGGGGKAISIARWFVDRIKEKKVAAPPLREKENKVWTECEVGGSRLYVEFKRPS